MTRTLVIGLELGDGPLLLAGARSGLLPCLRGLLDRGISGELATTAEQLHVSAWPSLYTGVGPGEHGVYFTFQPAPGVQGHQRFHDGLYGRPTVWSLLAQAGRACSVLDAPYTHPEPGFPGLQIIDWGSWAQYLRTTSVPADALGELRRAVGDYPMGLEAHGIGLAAQDPADIEARILRALPAKAAAAAWSMQHRPWDMFFVVFGETHPAAHYCWSPEDAGQARLMRIYGALDRAIGHVIEAAGDDCAVIVVSGDAVGPNHAGWHLLPEILARQGYLASAEFRPADDRPTTIGTSRDPVKMVRDLLPKNFRKSLAGLLPTRMRDQLAKRVDTASIDWQRTRAFCLPTDLEGLIRVNLKGREPEGIVEPGAAYEKLLDELTAGLVGLTDPTTGHRVVADVLRTDGCFPGLRRQHLPDLVVLWDRARPIEAVTVPGFGSVAGASPDKRPGTHTGPGFVVGSGPGILPGATLDAANVLDVAPTLLARFDLTPPPYMTGRPLRSLLAA